MELNREQLAILDHTAHRAAGGFYCGDSPDMQALVAAGLMESAGRKSFVPDEYFRMTGKGREALRSDKPEYPARGEIDNVVDTSVCECWSWANAGGDDAAQQLLTGHHPQCVKGDFRKSALGLIADLAQALEAWGREEDGIPEFAWEPYRRAKALQGVFLACTNGGKKK